MLEGLHCPLTPQRPLVSQPAESGQWKADGACWVGGILGLGVRCAPATTQNPTSESEPLKRGPGFHAFRNTPGEFMEQPGLGTTGQRRKSPRQNRNSGKRKLASSSPLPVQVLGIWGQIDTRFAAVVFKSHTHGFTHQRNYKVDSIWNLYAILQGKGLWGLTLLPA